MRKSLLWLLLAVVPLLGGCWDAIEIENLKFIMVMGIDREPSGRVLVSLHAVNVEQLNVSTESSSSSGGELPYYLTTVRGAASAKLFTITSPENTEEEGTLATCRQLSWARNLPKILCQNV